MNRTTRARPNLLSTTKVLALILSGASCLSAPATAGDQKPDELEAFRKAAQSCKTSQNQEILFKAPLVSGKSEWVAATPEEEKQVKHLLAKSNMPYDKVNHRASYEFMLKMIRTRIEVEFEISTTDGSEDLSPVRECLSKLSASFGFEYIHSNSSTIQPDSSSRR